MDLVPERFQAGMGARIEEQRNPHGQGGILTTCIDAGILSGESQGLTTRFSPRCL
jgi:hypothetical protein